MNKKKGFALICFYEASTGGHGSSEVTSSLYNCLPQKNKNIFEIKKKKFFNLLEYYKFSYLENIYKIFYIIIIFKKFSNFIKKYKKKIVIVEGASWIGYSYFFIKITKFFYSDAKIVYHAHNVEYEIRKKKSNLIIANLSRILEKKVYKISDYPTTVSNEDHEKIKKLYGVNTYIFSNGINKKRLLIKKPNFYIPKKFIIYSGSYSYLYNKLAINKIIYKIMPKILKQDKEIKLIVTGKDFPKNKFKNFTFVKSYLNLDKKELNYLIKNSLFMLAPMAKSPGTKLKVIETLLLGANLITSKEGFKGIKLIKSNNLFIYSNINQMYQQIKYLLKNYKKIKSINKINLYLKHYLMENILKVFLRKINQKDI